jgi:hypothetical protein
VYLKILNGPEEILEWIKSYSFLRNGKSFLDMGVYPSHDGIISVFTVLITASANHDIFWK